MKSTLLRVALVVAALMTLFSLTRARALAVVEYCPASVDLTPVLTASAGAADSSASLYKLSLRALSPRSVSGTVAVHTSDGGIRST